MKSLYLIAILPPDETSQRIDNLRKALSAKYQVYKALRPPVHITLYKPVWIESSDEVRLVEAMRLVADQSVPFQQEVQDYSRFGKRVLYLKVLSNPELQALQQKVVAAFLREGFDKKGTLGEAYHPHFTLAFRDVTPEKFDNMWQEYQDKQFSERFPVDAFAILRHDGSKWQVLENLPLGKPSREP